MCTISWYKQATGYRVFFNRDERKTRSKAVPPKIIDLPKSQAIMPIDPDGGGSWCAVNHHGLTFALLNFYQGRLPKGKLLSRGQVIKGCADLADVDAAVSLVQSLPLNQFAPFSLLIFAPQSVMLASSDALKAATNEPHVLSDGAVRMLRWTGKALEQSYQLSPLISSALAFETVYAARKNLYHQMLAGRDESALATEELLAFHRTHEPEKSALSVCMHREDAHTVSLSVIEVDAQRCSYRYSDGAPCRADLGPALTLARRLQA